MKKIFLHILSLAVFLLVFSYQNIALAQIPSSEGYPWEKIENPEMGVSIEVPTLGKEIELRRIEAGYMRIEISEATESDPFNYDYILEIYSGPADSLKIINRMQECDRDIKVVNETPLSIVCIPQRYGESFSTKVLFVLSDEKEFLVSLGDRNIDRETSNRIIDSFRINKQ